ALDAVLAYFKDPPRVPDDLEALDPVSLEALRSKLSVRSWLLWHGLPVTPRLGAHLSAIKAADALLARQEGDGAAEAADLAERLQEAVRLHDAVEAEAHAHPRQDGASA